MRCGGEHRRRVGLAIAERIGPIGGDDCRCEVQTQEALLFVDLLLAFGLLQALAAEPPWLPALLGSPEGPPAVVASPGWPVAA